MKIAIYARVSTDGQDTSYQVDDLKEFAGKKEWEVYKVFVDNESGRTGRQTRKGFDAMLTAARERKFELLLIWSLDRFTREGMFKTISYLQILDACGVRFYSFKEPDLNTENELVRSILIALLSSLAKIEAQKISERTKSGIARARRNGKIIGRPSKRNYLDDIVALVNDGKTDTAIMEELKLSRNTVKKYKRQAGLLV